MGLDLKKHKTAIIIGGVLFGVVLLSSGCNALRHREVEVDSTPVTSTKDKDSKPKMTDEEREQERLTKMYGEAPEGFKWKDGGDLLSLGDTSLTAEEVAYNYLKSASMMDFDMLQRSSQNSKVAKTYQNFYEDSSYSDAFKRKMYKLVLKSMTINELTDSALFANDKYIFTFSINALDLTEKDFWKQDKDTIFNNLKAYYREEEDSTKASQYIYEYILNHYSSDNPPMKDVSVELTVTKNDEGAWLVTDDTDLNNLCKYTDGETVNSYIYECYRDWYDKTFNR